MAGKTVKRAFEYRFYPTNTQAAELSRTFGCVRLVYNKALAARTRAWYQNRERVNYNATSAMLTAWKKEEGLAFLSEVSSVPLQQTLRHLQGGFADFFAKRDSYPRFTSKKTSRASAEYTPSAFRYRDGRLFLAKMSEPLGIVWSRPLPQGAAPSTVTVSRDAAGRWFVSLLCEDVPATDAAWSTTRSMLEYKCAWYGRELVVVDRFFPSTRLCSAPGCGYVNAKMPLNVREWTCPRCGTVHDRDVNAANNLRAAGLAVAAGPPLCDRGEARTVGEGAGVRPQRESSRTGRSVSKQEGHGATRDGATAPNHR